MRPVVASGSRKRGAGDQGDQDEDRDRSRTVAAPTTSSTEDRSRSFRGRVLGPTKSVAAPTTSSTDPIAEPMDQDRIDLERRKAEKSRASKEVIVEFQTEEEKKQPCIGDGPLDYLETEDVLMIKLEDAEKRTVHVATEDYYMPMMTCEDSRYLVPEEWEGGDVV